jgi:peptidyl-prolyl cis-trans isomerase A (cyclophilin A)
MLYRFALLIAALFLAPAAASAQETIDVVLETEMGDIVIALEAERAPVTTANFLRYVDEDRLDGTVFYRAMRLDWGEQPNGLIQGGTQYDPERILGPIAHEPTTATGLSHTAGTISMARYEPGSATGDFSIMLSDQPGLDADPNGETDDARAGFAAFGRVVQGMDVVRAIFEAPTDPEKGEGFMKGQMLAEPVKIVDARRVSRPD